MTTQGSADAGFAEAPGDQSLLRVVGGPREGTYRRVSHDFVWRRNAHYRDTSMFETLVDRSVA